VPVAEHVFNYARDLVRATRPGEPGVPPYVNELVQWGAGPRAGIYLIMAFDPEVLFNEGFHDLVEVRLPEGTIVKPTFPAPLGLLNITLARQLDVVQGILAQCAPAYVLAPPSWLYAA